MGLLFFEGFIGLPRVFLEIQRCGRAGECAGEGTGDALTKVSYDKGIDETDVSELAPTDCY